jgi:uncharacterized membrane protein required for colicin V production
MEQDWSKNLSIEGTNLGKKGTVLLGFIVDANTQRPGTYQVRCPAIHGYCDINEQNCEEDHVAKDALPIAATLKSTHGNVNSGISNNALATFGKGDFVLVKFDADDYGDPIILSSHKETDSVFADENTFSKVAPKVIETLVNKHNNVFSASQGNNGCFEIVTASDRIPENGKDVKGANKCGENGSIGNSMNAVIGDFLKIIQDTDGKIGSKFVNNVTGELFSITGYLQKYLASIMGIMRGGLAWIKAIVTKYVRQAIDALVKAIMVPIKGITSTITEVFEEILNSVFCSFGDIESMLSNMIEDLLNTLVDSAIGSVFGCLTTLIDGVLNEVLGEVLGMMNDIMAGISSIAGIIGGFGDMLGEAINAILDFLGISCGGSGDCGTAASKNLINAFNNPGEFGLTTGLKKNLNSGLSALDGVSASIGKETSKLNAEAANFAKGVDLGTAKVPGVSANNEDLKNAFTTAANLLSPEISDVFDFCNNLSDGNTGGGSRTTPDNPGIPDDDGNFPPPPGGDDVDDYSPSTTTGVVIGKPDDKYDAVYVMTPIGSEVQNGQVQKIKIKRNNTNQPATIIFAVHLKSTDTARVAGITPGVNTGGDIEFGPNIDQDQYADSATIPPIATNIVKSEKLYFAAGEKSKIVNIQTLKNKAPLVTIASDKFHSADKQKDFVTYQASIYRSVEDLDLGKYPYKNTPSTSSILNTRQLKIKYVIDPAPAPDTTVISNPPEMITQNINYIVDDVSVIAGELANFTVIRSPNLSEETQIKATTQDNTALSGTHFTGGTAVLKFGPGVSSVTFSVPTNINPNYSNQTFDFSVLFQDVLLPQGSSSNLGGSGATGGTAVGAGITKIGVISYVPTQKPSASCNAEILLPTLPSTCIVQEESIPLKLGFISKASVPGYTFTYQWQRTYEPNGVWTDVANGVRNETINELVTTYGPSDVTFTDSNTGQSVTLNGWDTSTVAQSASVTYAGATTNELLIDPVSYLICDEEYYRCQITATPVTQSTITPVLNKTTDNIYIGVTKSNVYLSTVNCAPPGTLSDGNTITYPNTAPNPQTAISATTGLCVEPSPEVPPDDIDQPVIPEPDDDVPIGVGLPNPSGDPIKVIIPHTDPGIISIPIVIGPGGGVVSFPRPITPRYKQPPLVPISGLGFGAIAKAEIDDDGNLTDIIIMSPGTGYAASEPNLCGILTSIVIQNPGRYFKSSPTVFVDGDPNIAVAAIDENGRVVEIRITNPKDIVYDRIPRIYIDGAGGIGAYAKSVVNYVPCDQVSDRYLNVVNKYNESKVGTVSIVDCP